ncbi:MAG: DUF427 domain-containing protein [Candidatus Bathyarchaeia archaeon]
MGRSEISVTVMARALWNNVVIAESSHYEKLEGSVYFPPEAIRKEYFQQSETRIISPWKGEAIYFNIVIDGAKNKDAAWHYPEPKEAAKNIKGYMTFSRVKGIVVEEESAS